MLSEATLQQFQNPCITDNSFECFSHVFHLLRYRAAAAFLTASIMKPRVGFHSYSVLLASAEHLLSAFACDLVKIVSVADNDTLDVVLHMTISRGDHPIPLSELSKQISWFCAGGSPSSRREVMFALLPVHFSCFITHIQPSTGACMHSNFIQHPRHVLI